MDDGANWTPLLVTACRIGRAWDLNTMFTDESCIFVSLHGNAVFVTLPPLGGIVLVSFCLVSTWGSREPLVLPFLTLTSVLHLKDSRQSNEQTNNTHNSYGSK